MDQSLAAQIKLFDAASRLSLTPGVPWHGEWPAGRIERNRRIYDYELIYFSAGRGRVVFADETFYCRAGSVIVIPPDRVHCTIIESAAERWCVHFDWYGDWQRRRQGTWPFVYLDDPVPFDASRIAAAPPPELGLGFPLIRRLEGNAGETLLKLLREYFMLPAHTFPELLERQSLLLRILAIALTERGAEKPASSVSGRGSVRFFHAKSILDARSAEPGLRIREVAAELRITPNHLSKLFRNEIGMSASDYLQSRRLELAARLLLETELTVAEIAHEAGFDDPNYFTRFFRRRHGVTPTSFRLQRAGND